MEEFEVVLALTIPTAMAILRGYMQPYNDTR